MTIRAVLDTNTVISALLWKGTPHRVLRAVYFHPIRFYTSSFLFQELATTLAKDKFDEPVKLLKTSRAVLLAHYQQIADTVEPDFIPEAVSDCPPDNHVLACALKVKANVIVSGDGHLKELNSYEGIPIMNAAGFMNKYFPSKE